MARPTSSHLSFVETVCFLGGWCVINAFVVLVAYTQIIEPMFTEFATRVLVAQVLFLVSTVTVLESIISRMTGKEYKFTGVFFSNLLIGSIMATVVIGLIIYPTLRQRSACSVPWGPKLQESVPFCLSATNCRNRHLYFDPPLRKTIAPFINIRDNILLELNTTRAPSYFGWHYLILRCEGLVFDVKIKSEIPILIETNEREAPQGRILLESLPIEAMGLPTGAYFLEEYNQQLLWGYCLIFALLVLATFNSFRASKSS